jgi:hypothetical protein
MLCLTYEHMFVGGESEAVKKELKQEKAKRKASEMELDREKTKNSEERDEAQRKLRRMEER